MSLLLAIVLANAACAAVLAIPAFLASRYGRPALAHALWLLVLLKLVMPPFIRPPLAWLPVEAPAAQVQQPAPVAEQVEYDLDAFPPTEFAATPKAAPAAVAPVSVALPRVEQPSQPIAPAALVAPQVEPAAARSAATLRAPDPADPQRLLTFLGLVWLAGAVVCLGRAVLYAASFQRLLKHARRAPEALQRQARELAGQMGMKSCPTVWLVPGALPPMVWGLGSARILFPRGLLDRLGAEERASLLAHELGHIARHDHWVRWLELIVLTAYWWYPLAWWARHQLQAREEECCDARAAATVPRRVYAAAILEAIDFLAEARPRIPSVASPLARLQSLKQRLHLIMSSETPSCLGVTMRLVLVAVFAAVLPLLPVLCPAAGPPTPRPDQPAAKADDEPDAEPTAFHPYAVNLVGGADLVFSVAYSPDGKYIAAGVGNSARPGQVDCYDAMTRKLLWRRLEPRGVSSVFFSHDSKRLGWSGFGGLLRVHDLASRKDVYSLSLDGNNRIAFSPDGRWLAVANEDASLRLYDALNGRPAHVFRGDLVNFHGLGFSRNSKLLAAAGGKFNGVGPQHTVVFDLESRKQVAKLAGHTKAVINAVFSPGDEYLATASADNTVRIWSTKTWKLVKTLEGHTNTVKGLSFSPDGKALMTGSWDKTIRLWSVPAGDQLAVLEGHPDAVREIAWSPDGRFLVSGGEQRSVKLWDAKKLKELATLSQDPAPLPGQRADASAPIVMAVSPDGKMVATGTESGAIQLLDSLTGKPLKTLKGHEDATTTLAFSRDGKILASSGPEAKIRLWDPETGKELHTLEGHDSWVFALAFSHDGKTLASGSYDKTIRLWSLERKQELRRLKGHKASVRSLAFSPDDLRLVSGSADKTVRVWDLKMFQVLKTLKGHEGAVRVVAYSPDGRTLASVSEDNSLRLWDPKTLTERATSRTHTTEALSLAFSPRGRLLVTGAQGGAIHYRDPFTGVVRSRRQVNSQGIQELAFGAGGRELFALGGDRSLRRWQAIASPLRYFDGHKGPVRIAVASPDGRYVLSCGGWPEGDKTARLWERSTGKEVRTFSGNKDANLQSAVFSPDGKFALVGGTNGKIWQWEAATGKLVREFAGHTEGVAHLTFSRDGKKLLSSSHDKTLRLWDFSTGRTLRTFTGHTNWARVAVFLPGEERIVSGGRDRVLRIWDVETAKQLKPIEHQKEWVESLIVSGDGKRLFSCGGNYGYLWDLTSRKLIRTFSGHIHGVTSIALSKDERTLLSSSYDGSVRCWDVASGMELQRFTGHRNFVWSVALTPDGKHFLSAGGGDHQGGAFVAGDDFAIRLWKMPTQVLARAP